MKLTAYRDAKGLWRWTITARNGKTVCASSEAFTTLAKCRRNAGLTLECLWLHELPVKPDFQIEFSNEAEIVKGKK